MMDYEAFVRGKAKLPPTFGREPDVMPKMLYPFQVALTQWAVRRGRAAIFADCGMGKTLMQVEWARQSGDRVLIVSPLAVAEQTIREAKKIKVKVTKLDAPHDDPGIHITNYEKLHKFIGQPYDAIVLDESSILKSLDGKTRTMLLREFTGIPRRLCCTATPAPNDVSELANHAEFLGAMSRPEMLASYFVHDSDGAGAGTWRLRGHARKAFWRWVATWAMYVRRPSDLGFDDKGWTLPPLEIHDSYVDVDWRAEGELFTVGLGGITDRRDARKASLDARVERAAGIIGESKDQWLVWCDLNAEAEAIAKALGDDAVEISGRDDEQAKIAKEAAWRLGEKRVLVTKPSVFGWGMNWQHCSRMMFLGLGDSYEAYYQAIRRCWRFGQDRPVEAWIVTGKAEREVAENVRRKEREASAMADGVIQASKEVMMESIEGAAKATATEYRTDEATGEGWRMLLGDCVERIKEIADESVGLSVFSPPFASLYTYSASDRDMGNSKDYDEFFAHFGFLIPELLRVTIPGRRCCVHVQQVSLTKAVHGVIGWRDFRADTVRAFVAAGWVYDGEVVIDKDPQAQAIRTKSKALMFVQKDKDSSWSRPAMADYILLFRHPGENPIPVKTDATNDEWIQWARPIWYGIRESDTLQAAEARSDDDEKHICPLQLGTIERCVRLWSNPGETVLSPFGGIGSEGFVSLQKDRKYIGIELKPEYWKVAVKNLGNARRQLGLFGAA